MTTAAAKAREAFPSVEALLGGRHVLRVKLQTTLDWIITRSR
jgi:hypothetical protein